ncbi:DUF3307 domain-containing protein [Paragemmobacter straminiformis]|uniref:DUF3307 domain-containing protein n=1 Tax=Paragemmobacter straminiformis TaxID=2045119 RepID=A0A842I6N5_9RHOB|nr:DUF3307 domain-containing protein [Gemmobacter straminiformis]MBC2835286.1 DUF3307 domain-containing protein [Gemmobacter straminiformis]
MFETLAALLFAHALADFLLQPAAMAAAKRRPVMLAAHGGVVLATALLASGSLHPALLVLTVLHMATDYAKARLPARFATFLADQALHLATLAAIAATAPAIWAGGLWSGMTALPPLYALLAGAIIAIRAGGFAIGQLMQPWADQIALDGLPGGGRAIGHLERGLIFLMVLGGMAEGIGFLIAAKSVLRFGTVREEAKLSEYVIIGTLASFAWALVTAFATLALLAHLAPLGIPDFTP